MPDETSAQKDNVRDTAKWMATAYAALSGVIVAGAPFSALGGLDWWRLLIAVGGGVVSIACSLLAMRSILVILIGSNSFINSLDSDATKFVNDNAAQVLPSPFTTLADFLAYQQELRRRASELWLILKRKRQGETEDEWAALQGEYSVVAKRQEEAQVAAANIVGLAHLHLLRKQLNGIRRKLEILTVVALVSLGVAVWAATSKEKPKSDGPNVALPRAFDIATWPAQTGSFIGVRADTV
jgi:hypothetical protein